MTREGTGYPHPAKWKREAVAEVSVRGLAGHCWLCEGPPAKETPPEAQRGGKWILPGACRRNLGVGGIGCERTRGRPVLGHAGSQSPHQPAWAGTLRVREEPTQGSPGNRPGCLGPCVSVGSRWPPCWLQALPPPSCFVAGPPWAGLRHPPCPPVTPGKSWGQEARPTGLGDGGVSRAGQGRASSLGPSAVSRSPVLPLALPQGPALPFIPSSPQHLPLPSLHGSQAMASPQAGTAGTSSAPNRSLGGSEPMSSLVTQEQGA